MGIQITIVGLGQIGASVGLGLANHNGLVYRVGYDRSIEIARRALNLEALDRIEISLPDAVRDADLVLLSLPMDQIRNILTIIAPELKPGAVVMDTGPVKETVAAWAGELLPGGRHYIGLTPVLNPAYLHETGSGQEVAHADLFRGGLIAIVAPPRTGSEALKLAADLTRLLGASPLFIEPVEIDSLMASTHLLPQLMAAALLNATIDKPGWTDGQQVAGRAYAEATGPIMHMSETQTLCASVLLNREHVLRVMDSTIAALQALRSDIDAEDREALAERLERARLGREKWWEQRQAGDFMEEPAAVVPEESTSSDIFSRLLRFDHKRYRKET